MEIRNSNSVVEGELQWVRPPMQERSHQTMERLLVSAENLINEVGFDKATVSGIAKGARSSVGAFYTRFPDKHALLRCLLERFVSESIATLEYVGRPSLWQQTSFRDLFTRLLAFSMQEFRKREKLLFAFAQLTDDYPELAGFRETLTNCCAEKVFIIIESKGAHVTCREPERAIAMVTWMTMCLSEASVTQRSPYASAEARDLLVQDVGEMVLKYLAIVEPGKEIGNV